MKSTNTIVLFGCKSTTKFILQFFLKRKYDVQLVTIDNDKGRSQMVADYCCLNEFCIKNGVNIYQAKKYSLKSDNDFEFFINKKHKLGFVVGWQRLIPEKILNTFSIGVFGMHGSSMNLPKGRGRSPMNWSIIEGRKVFYTNLFRYNAGVDDGDILDTFKFQINDHDTSETMHFKNTLSMKFLIEKNMDILLNDNFKLSKQIPLKPSYYPKRNESDSLIDWDDDIVNIEKLIRAVTKPFNGAYSFINNGHKIIIYRANIFDFQDFGYDSAKAGEILSIFDNGKFLLKSFGGILIVHEYKTEKIIKTGDLLSNGKETKNYFDSNNQGFYDI